VTSTRRSVVVASVAVVLVGGVLFALGAGSHDAVAPDAGRGPSTGSGRPRPSPTIVTTAPPPSAFARRVDRRCERVPRQPAIPVSATPAQRAAQMGREAVVLSALHDALAAARVPHRATRLMRFYLLRLRAQIVLDERLALAASDEEAIENGMAQNVFNRRARSKLARQLGFSDCLRDAGTHR
jgi:hypothetical protein